MIVLAPTLRAVAALPAWLILCGVASADIVGAPPNVTPPPPSVTPAPPNVTPAPLFTRPSASGRRLRTCRIYAQTDKSGFVRLVRRCR